MKNDRGMEGKNGMNGGPSFIRLCCFSSELQGSEATWEEWRGEPDQEAICKEM